MSFQPKLLRSSLAGLLSGLVIFLSPGIFCYQALAATVEGSVGGVPDVIVAGPEGVATAIGIGLGPGNASVENLSLDPVSDPVRAEAVGRPQVSVAETEKPLLPLPLGQERQAVESVNQDPAANSTGRQQQAPVVYQRLIHNSQELAQVSEGLSGRSISSRIFDGFRGKSTKIAGIVFPKGFRLSQRNLAMSVKDTSIAQLSPRVPSPYPSPAKQERAVLGGSHRSWKAIEVIFGVGLLAAAPVLWHLVPVARNMGTAAQVFRYLAPLAGKAGAAALMVGGWSQIWKNYRQGGQATKDESLEADLFYFGAAIFLAVTAIIHHSSLVWLVPNLIGIAKSVILTLQVDKTSPAGANWKETWVSMGGAFLAGSLLIGAARIFSWGSLAGVSYSLAMVCLFNLPLAQILKDYEIWEAEKRVPAGLSVSSQALIGTGGFLQFFNAILLRDYFWIASTVFSVATSLVELSQIYFPNITNKLIGPAMPLLARVLDYFKRVLFSTRRTFFSTMGKTGMQLKA